MTPMLVAASLLAASAAPAPADKPPLKLTVRLDKDAYTPGDPVKLSFDLTNESDSAVYVADGFLAPDYHEVGPSRHLELVTADEDGTRFRFWSGQATEGHTAGVRKVFRVEPKKSYSGEIVLTEGAFATIATDKKHALGKDAKKYTISLKYTAAGDYGVHQPPKEFDPKLLWKGELTSNEATLQFK